MVALSVPTPHFSLPPRPPRLRSGHLYLQGLRSKSSFLAIKKMGKILAKRGNSPILVAHSFNFFIKNKTYKSHET